MSRGKRILFTSISGAGPMGDTLERPFQGVPAPHPGGALRHDQPCAAVIPDVGNPGPQVQLNGDAEGVESTAQVGDRPGDNDLPSGCSIEAAGLK